MFDSVKHWWSAQIPCVHLLNAPKDGAAVQVHQKGLHEVQRNLFGFELSFNIFLSPFQQGLLLLAQNTITEFPSHSQAALCTRAEDRSEKNKGKTIAHAVYWWPTKAILSWSSFRSIPPENIGWRDGNWTTTFCLREGMEKIMPAREESTSEEEEYVPFHISCHYWISSGFSAIQFAVNLNQYCNFFLSEAYLCVVAQFHALRTEHHLATAYAIFEGETFGSTFVSSEIQKMFEKGSARSVEARGAAGWESFNDEEEVEGNHRGGYWRRKGRGVWSQLGESITQTSAITVLPSSTLAFEDVQVQPPWTVIRCTCEVKADR